MLKLFQTVVFFFFFFFFFCFFLGGGGGGGVCKNRENRQVWQDFPYDLKKSFLRCNMDRIYFDTTQNTCFDSRPIGFCIVLLKAQLVIKKKSANFNNSQKYLS